MYSMVDSLLFFLPKGLKSKVKGRILAQRDRAKQRAKGLRENMHAGQGKADVASVSPLTYASASETRCSSPGRRLGAPLR